MTLPILTHGLAALLLVAALPLLLATTTLRWRRRCLGWTVLLHALWAALMAVPAAEVLVSDWLLMAVDALRYGAALCLLMVLGTIALRAWIVRAALTLCLGALLLAVTAQVLARYAGWSDDLSRLPGLGALLLTVSGLVLVEQVLRNSPLAGGRALRLCALAIGGLFACDLFVAVQANVPSGVDSAIWALRPAVYLLLLPVLWVGMRQLEGQPPRAFVSRQVVFYGSAALAVGLYLVLASVAAWLLRTQGGSWSEPLRLLLLLGALAVLAVVLLSESPARWLKVFIAKHFYSNKYDYRVEWLRFIATLSNSGGGEADARTTVIRAIAQIVGSPGGVLYQRDGPDSPWLPVASWHAGALPLAPVPVLQPDDSLPQFMASSGWVVDLQEYQHCPERYCHMAVPPSLLEADANWRIVLPLQELDRMAGVLLLQAPPPPFQMIYEDRDLLKTVGRHVATLLAQQQAAQRLAEGQQFDAFNRFGAFVMHDIKNSVAQLQLLVGNAARHRHNPQFMDDAIDTIVNTVERMTRLIQQLQARDAQSGERRVDILALLQTAVQRAAWRAPAPQLQCGAQAASLNADPDRLAAVFDHLIRNAQDAAGPGGQVQVELSLEASRCRISVRDNGPGMDAQFVRDRLFKPFDTTKGSRGMGIGAYQARAYVQQLRGALEVQTSPRNGTTLLITVPL